MFPWVYEFRWTAGHLVFLGAFFTVIVVIVRSVLAAGRKAAADIARGRYDAIRWHEDFEELPSRARRCRHDLSGEVRGRTCPNGFDCRGCELHPGLVARQPAGVGDRGNTVSIGGVSLPLDRMYHRGHTWVRDEGDGTCTVGLDAFASRIVGPPDDVSLPAPGTPLRMNAPACSMGKDGRRYPVLAPVDGTVTEAGGSGGDWWIRLRPADPIGRAAHLLRGSEVRAWISGELERVEVMASSPGSPVSLADGGELLPDLGGQLGPRTLDDVRAGILLTD